MKVSLTQRKFVFCQNHKTNENVKCYVICSMSPAKEPKQNDKFNYSTKYVLSALYFIFFNRLLSNSPLGLLKSSGWRESNHAAKIVASIYYNKHRNPTANRIDEKWKRRRKKACGVYSNQASKTMTSIFLLFIFLSEKFTNSLYRGVFDKIWK